MIRFLKAALAAAVIVAAPHPVLAAANEGSCPDYDVRGEGPDVLLVPGLASAPEVWDDLAENLSATNRIHFVHVAGFAGKEAAATEGVIAASAEEIMQYIDCRGLDKPALIGHSMGGFTGLRIARDEPALLGRLMIVDALPFYPLIFSPSVTVEAVEPQAAAMRTALTTMDDATFRAQQTAMAARFARNNAVHDRIVGWSVTSDRAFMAQAMYELMTSDLRTDLPTISIPVTVVYAHSKAVPEARAKSLFEGAYEGLANVHFVPIGPSYHFIMFDQADAFAAAVAAFLND